MHFRKIALIVFFILITNYIVFSQPVEEEGTGEEWAPTDPDTYKTTDPKDWDYDDPDFNWNYVPPEKIPDVPEDKMDVTELNDEQLKKLMQANLFVQNLEKNLTLIRLIAIN